MSAGKFQVKLSEQWRDYSKEEDKILKRAYMAGFKGCKFHLRGQDYQYDFKKMVQKNVESGKERQIRCPHRWTQPSAPIVPEGKTTVVNVPAGSPGSVVQVPYPGVPGKLINVNVPAKARVGQAMLVPVPPIDQAVSASAPVAAAAPVQEKKEGWSTGGKVAAGTAAVVGVAGAAVGGAILGSHIAEHGLDATVDAVGDGLADAGEAIGDAAVDAGEFIVDGAEEVGDFIMDLF
jgi:hypothetical protein